jgi:hypothetical protein
MTNDVYAEQCLKLSKEYLEFASKQQSCDSMKIYLSISKIYNQSAIINLEASIIEAQNEAKIKELNSKISKINSVFENLGLSGSILKGELK